MRTARFLLTLSLLVLGCGQSNSQNKATDFSPTNATRTAKPTNESAGYWEKLVMHPFVDGKGTVIVEMPFPASWKIMSNPQRGEPSITGPNHIKVIDFPAQSFIYTSDRQMQQIYRRSGQPLRPLPGIEQLVRQDLAPWCAGQGLAFVRQYEVPEVSRIDWKDRNAASDKAQEQFVDVITERTKVADPSTGKQYKVESGSNQYWMNREGEYFGTDNRAYDPNSDENMNRQNWQKLKTVE